MELPTMFPNCGFMSFVLKNTMDWFVCSNPAAEQSFLSLTHSLVLSCFLVFIKQFGRIESKNQNLSQNKIHLYFCLHRNKTLMFAIMLTEKSLSWYSELLRLSMTESRDFQINPRNCIGTVLSLNGHRKYFCMYHAKHPETSRGTKVE